MSSVLVSSVAFGTSGGAASQRSARATPPPALGKSNPTRIADGVWWTRINLKTPERINVIRITPSSTATVDTVLAAGDTLPGYRQTSAMVSADGGVAGVNGDFGFPPGRPAHAFETNGWLVQTSLLGTLDFAQRQSKKAIQLGHTAFAARVADGRSGRVIPIDEWNFTKLQPKQIGAYSSFGGSVGGPPRNSCYAQLAPTGPRFWVKGRWGIAQPFDVGAVACQQDPPPFNGGVVLAAVPGTRNARHLATLHAGDAARLTWNSGWPDVLDMVGGNPLLVYHGRVVAPRKCTVSLCRRNPRTAVGVTAGGAILLVTIDGRWPKNSIGMTVFSEARFMKHLGAVNALNLDGGGSTTMVVDGKVVNHPSGGSERYVTNAVAVLPGRDPNDPILPVGPSSALSSLVAPAVFPFFNDLGPTPWWMAQRAARQAMRDPGSTGGLLQTRGGG